jgi:hypothetical protein
MNLQDRNVAFLNRGRRGPGDGEAPGAMCAGGFGEAMRQTDAVSSTSRLRVRFGSTGMPGPMVVETVTFFR